MESHCRLVTSKYFLMLFSTVLISTYGLLVPSCYAMKSKCVNVSRKRHITLPSKKSSKLSTQMADKNNLENKLVDTLKYMYESGDRNNVILNCKMSMNSIVQDLINLKGLELLCNPASLYEICEDVLAVIRQDVGDEYETLELFKSLFVELLAGIYRSLEGKKGLADGRNTWLSNSHVLVGDYSDEAFNAFLGDVIKCQLKMQDLFGDKWKKMLAFITFGFTLLNVLPPQDINEIVKKATSVMLKIYDRDVQDGCNVLMNLARLQCGVNALNVENWGLL